MSSQLMEKGLPANLNAERYILGSIILQGNEVFAATEAALSAEDFALEAHRRIYGAIRDLDREGRQIGRIEVAEQLIRSSELESVGGLSYLVSLDDGLPIIHSIDSYVQIVRDKSTLRKIIHEARLLENRALAADDDPSNILANADSILSRLSERDESQAEWMNPGQIIESYQGGLSSFITPSRGGSGLQLPWPAINNTICGLQPGDLMLIAGRPSHGKSAAGLQIAYETARTGRGVAYFSLEMSRESLVRRMIAQLARVDSQRMRLGFLSSDERRAISVAASQISSIPLWIDYRGYTTPAIRLAIKKLRSRQDVSMVVIDHFHLLQSIGREEDRQRYARTADDVQRYAKEFAMPFVVLAQLNRKCEDENRPPGLPDLNETGKLEQNADIVMFCHRPEMYSRNRQKEELRGLAEFIIGKQRNGPVGKVDMIFEKQYQTFHEAVSQ